MINLPPPEGLQRAVHWLETNFNDLARTELKLIVEGMGHTDMMPANSFRVVRALNWLDLGQPNKALQILVSNYRAEWQNCGYEVAR